MNVVSTDGIKKKFSDKFLSGLLPSANHMLLKTVWEKAWLNIVFYLSWDHIKKSLNRVKYLLRFCHNARTNFLPINNWLFSCRWMCPSAGASCVAAGSSSRRSDASLTLRSAWTRCHLLSFSGKPAFTWTSNGPLPTSKEKRTSVEAVAGKKENQGSL